MTKLPPQKPGGSILLLREVGKLGPMHTSAIAALPKACIRCGSAYQEPQ